MALWGGRGLCILCFLLKEFSFSFSSCDFYLVKIIFIDRRSVHKPHGDRTEPPGHVLPGHLSQGHIPPGHLPPGHLPPIHIPIIGDGRKGEGSNQIRLMKSGNLQFTYQVEIFSVKDMELHWAVIINLRCTSHHFAWIT